ncbi:MAG: hypothetical protein J5791_07855 [Fibrobacter sp.]|nr:hypothetical protein [Fibrobacter sp.]
MPEIESLIKNLSPLMEESSEIFRELAIFFGPGAKIATHQGDLSKFLGRKRLYRILRFSGNSYKECVYQLVDDHPESMEALGMLRYYISPGKNIKWEDIEAAEIALGKELTTNAYGWMPDAWTAFENADDVQGDGTGTHQLVALLAFDYGD